MYSTVAPILLYSSLDLLLRETLLFLDLEVFQSLLSGGEV